MNIFYTYTYGKDGKTIDIQDRIAKAANSLGYREISIYCDADEKNSIEQIDLDVQMDGSFSSFANNAILIMQYPSGAGYRYDMAIIEHAKRYGGTNLIIYNHPHKQDESITTEDEQRLLEQADLVVEPYGLEGFDELILTQKELIDAVLASTYHE